MPSAWSNIWSRMRATLGRPMHVQFGIASQLRGPQFIDIAGQAPKSLPSVYGCAALLSDALVSLDWWITKPAVNGGREQVIDGAAAQTLERWRKNERWAWLWNALIGGNGIGFVHRNEAGEPVAVEIFPIGRAWLNLYDDNSLRFSLAPMAGGESFEAPEEDVCCLRYRPSGLDPRVGVTPLATASPTITMLLATRSSTTATQLNASRPSGYLATDGKLDRDRAAEIKQRWLEAHGGPGQRGSTAVLEQGLKYTTIDPTDLVKLAAVETANLGVNEICRLFGVPQSLLQGEGSGARASAVEDRRRLGAFAVQPLARLIEDAIGSKLLSERQRDMGLTCTLDTSASLIGEGAEMSDTLSKLVNAGLITPNEGRAWLQYGSGGNDADLLRAPTNTWPIEAWSHAEPRSGDSMPAREFASARALRLIHGGRDRR